VQSLISSGHSWTEIKSYAPHELGCFITAAVRLREQEHKASALSAWIGSHADQKGIENYIKQKPGKKSAPDPDTVKSEFKRLAAFMSRHR
jgi:hypothetical protein